MTVHHIIPSLISTNSNKSSPNWLQAFAPCTRQCPTVIYTGILFRTCFHWGVQNFGLECEHTAEVCATSVTTHYIDLCNKMLAIPNICRISYNETMKLLAALFMLQHSHGDKFCIWFVSNRIFMCFWSSTKTWKNVTWPYFLPATSWLLVEGLLEWSLPIRLLILARLCKRNDEHLNLAVEMYDRWYVHNHFDSSSSGSWSGLEEL